MELIFERILGSMVAQIFSLGLAGIAYTRPRRKLKMPGGAPEKSASENRRAPERLPVVEKTFDICDLAQEFLNKIARDHDFV